MQLFQETISARMDVIEPGLDNARLQLEVVKRGDYYLIELVKHWVTHHHNGSGTVTTNHRVVMSQLDTCLHQNTVDAARPTSIGGIVARCKLLATQTGIPMTVNLPS